MALREKKPNKSDDDLKKMKAFFKRMFQGFNKKATEFSVLCGNSLCLICNKIDKDFERSLYELDIILSYLEFQLLVIRQHQIHMMEKETEDGDHITVSDTISNCKVVSSSSEDRLGFGGVFDELGYGAFWDFDVSSTALDDDAWRVSGFDPLLGPVYSFIGSTYQTPVTENWRVHVQYYDLMA